MTEMYNIRVYFSSVPWRCYKYVVPLNRLTPFSGRKSVSRDAADSRDCHKECASNEIFCACLDDCRKSFSSQLYVPDS